MRVIPATITDSPKAVYLISAVGPSAIRRRTQAMNVAQLKQCIYTLVVGIEAFEDSDKPLREFLICYFDMSNSAVRE